jgi:hypothetical protein
LSGLLSLAVSWPFNRPFIIMNPLNLPEKLQRKRWRGPLGIPRHPGKEDCVAYRKCYDTLA